MNISAGLKPHPTRKRRPGLLHCVGTYWRTCPIASGRAWRSSSSARVCWFCWDGAKASWAISNIRWRTWRKPGRFWTRRPRPIRRTSALSIGAWISTVRSGLVNGYAGNASEALQNLQKAVGILDVIVKRDTANAIYPMIRAELQGRVANLLLQAGQKNGGRRRTPRRASRIFGESGDSADATPQQLIEAVRSVAETQVSSLRDYPAALRFALRADQLAAGKNPAALGYLAEAYG